MAVSRAAACLAILVALLCGTATDACVPARAQRGRQDATPAAAACPWARFSHSKPPARQLGGRRPRRCGWWCVRAAGRGSARQICRATPRNLTRRSHQAVGSADPTAARPGAAASWTRPTRPPLTCGQRWFCISALPYLRFSPPRWQVVAANPDLSKLASLVSQLPDPFQQYLKDQARVTSVTLLSIASARRSGLPLFFLSGWRPVHRVRS